VRVYDYVGPEWQVEEAVNRFNVMLPKRAPRLIYVPMGGPCARPDRAISVCVIPDAQMSVSGAVGQNFTWSDDRRRAFKRKQIVFAASAQPALGLTCHELFHAMGVMDEGSWQYVQPCPYDDAIMRNLYKREKRHR
jgi:hypothetical protein